jgi:iron complex outermembrane recepter protein
MWTRAISEKSNYVSVGKGYRVGGVNPQTNNAQAACQAVTANGEYTFKLLSQEAYIWVEDAFHSANNGPFSTHNPANIVVYDPDLIADPSTNVLNLRTGVRLRTLDVSLFANNLTNTHPQLSLEHTNPGDPRFQAVTLRPLTVGITATLRY